MILVLCTVTFKLRHMPLLTELENFFLFFPAAHAAGYKYNAPSGLLRLGVFLALAMLFIVPLLLRGIF